EARRAVAGHHLDRELLPQALDVLRVRCSRVRDQRHVVAGGQLTREVVDPGPEAPAGREGEARSDDEDVQVVARGPTGPRARHTPGCLRRTHLPDVSGELLRSTTPKVQAPSCTESC